MPVLKPLPLLNLWSLLQAPETVELAVSVLVLGRGFISKGRINRQGRMTWGLVMVVH